MSRCATKVCPLDWIEDSDFTTLQFDEDVHPNPQSSKTMYIKSLPCWYLIWVCILDEIFSFLTIADLSKIVMTDLPFTCIIDFPVKPVRP